MKEIQLTKGYVAQVSDKDYAKVNQFKWYAKVDRRNSIRTVYAHRAVSKADGTKTMQNMHNFIMGAKGIDHEDSNGLNNQRYNLRPATSNQNNRHRKMNSNNTSGYKGVTWDKESMKWKASVQVDGRTVNLGRFPDLLDARDAADSGRLKYHKDFAMTNAMLFERAAA